MKHVTHVGLVHATAGTHLGPFRRTHEGEVLGTIFSDSTDHRIGIAGNSAHIRIHWFVIDFPNDIGNILVLCRHLAEEIISNGQLQFGPMAMPVHNNVNVVFDSGLHHTVKLLNLDIRARLVRIACEDLAFFAISAIAIVRFNTHGKTENIDAERLRRPGNDVFAIILRTHSIGPKKAHTAKHHLLVGLGTNHLISAGAQYSIVRNRANPLGNS